MSGNPVPTPFVEAPEQNGWHGVDLQTTLQELQRVVTALHHGLQSTTAAPPASAPPAIKGRPREIDTYQHLVEEVRAVVQTFVPEGATVAVASRGDEALLALPGRHGQHFPQTAEGVYAGHYPADSVGAIAQLEAVRARGAAYLLLPATAAWWLEHYDGFARHLESRYRLLHRGERCLIYDLTTLIVADGGCEASLRALAVELAELTEHEPRLHAALLAADRPRAGHDEEVRAALRAVEAALAGPARLSSLRCLPPVEWVTGETRTYGVMLINIGTHTWRAHGRNPVRLAVHFGGSSDWPHDGWATDQRFTLPDDLSPGESATVTVAVTAPHTTGEYVLRHRLVEESTANGWFDHVHRTTVVVAEAADGDNDADQPTAMGYAKLVSATRSVVEATVPAAARVAVVSRGDDALLAFSGREGQHFPQMDDGVYAGYYPEDSAAAISHLEALRARGAGYILLPATAFWWLEHYTAFRRYLDDRYHLLWRDGHCVIYELRERGAREDVRSRRSFWGRLLRGGRRGADGVSAEPHEGAER